MTNNSRIALLATGNELVEGDILNTNGQTIARLLTEHELIVGLHIITSDIEQDIVEALHFLLNSHQIIIITGGLGPTSDDRTRYALSTVIKQELLFDETSWENIKIRFAQRQLKPHDSNRQQALFPKGAEILANNNGSAPGCCVNYQNKIIYMLPGPPGECLPLFQEKVLPALLACNQQEKRTKLVWRLLGAVEGEIAALLDEAIKTYPVMTGYRIDYPYLDVKIYVPPTIAKDEIIAIVNPLLEPYLITLDNQDASTLLRTMINTYKHYITIDDTATYGHLQTKLLTPQTFPYLSFTHIPRSEQNNLHLKISGLAEYWSGKSPTGSTTITLQFLSYGKEESVDIALPFRNQYVIKYAIEYIAHQILKFLSNLTT